MNIIVIVADQQRRDLVGCYGCADVRTPNIDRLASEGVVFDNAYTVTPICAPARASMLTGLRPVHHGITRNPESGEVAGWDFTINPVCYHQILKDAGYACSHVGKWHVGSELRATDCGAEGVHHPGYGYPAKHPHYQQYLAEGGLPPFSLKHEMRGRYSDGSEGTILRALQDQPVEASIPYYLAEQTIARIREAAGAGKPFNIRCDFWGPHVPYIIPEPYWSMYDDAAIPEWPNYRESFEDKPIIQSRYLDYWGIRDLQWSDWELLVRGAYGYTTLIDDQVGRILDTIAEVGLADDTAVIYTADHGGMVGGHRLADKGPFLYDEICRIPFVARIPGVTSAGARDANWIYNYDIMPTALELGGAGVPEGLDARSILPVLAGDETRQSVAYVEFHGHQVPYCQRSIRTETHKYIFNAPEMDELYDLAADPHEMTNVAADPAVGTVLGDLRARLYDFLRSTGDPIRAFYEDTRMK